MLSRRVRNSRGRPINAPAAFIHPCRPIVANRPPVGPGWAHELKHDGYRLQIHVRDGRVRLYTMNGANWSDRYPLIIETAARITVYRGAFVMRPRDQRYFNQKRPRSSLHWTIRVFGVDPSNAK